MNELELIPQWVGVWGLLGFIGLMVFPAPKPVSRITAAIFVVVMGPIVWVLFLGAMLKWWVVKEREET